MERLLSKLRKMNWVFQESSTGTFSFNDLCEVLGELLEANVYIVSRKSKVLGVYYQVKEDSDTSYDPETGEERMPESFNEAFLTVEQTVANMTNEEMLEVFGEDYDLLNKYHTIIPILGGRQRWGTLLMTRYDQEFRDEDLVLAEYGATVVGLEIQRNKALEQEEEERERAVVQMAIGTLSYSEIEAVLQIFAELPGNEGLLVASKIADRSGITRSVIVNALRKLESAGVIESRSLGMKGTYIKIINDKFKDELSKVNM